MNLIRINLIPGMIILLLSLLIINGCASTPSNREDPSIKESILETELTTIISSHQIPDLQKRTIYKVDRYSPMTLSPGDRLIVEISEGEHFNGTYEINIDGRLSLPYVSPLFVLGKTIRQVEFELRNLMIHEKILLEKNAFVNCRIQQWSAIRVLVSGAVFLPGGKIINNRSVEHKNFLQTQKNGDYPTERFLTAALKHSGGVRPDADLSNITLVRNGVVTQLDISGIIRGSHFENIPLVAGDQIIIHSVGYKQKELMRPSEITPPGFEIFISNLTTPADSNSQSAIGKHSRSIAFGTRLLRGLISANCVGGTNSTNASRRAILVTTDVITRETRVIQQSIEELVRNHKRDEFNPYLMPNDGIACYDSNVTNIRDVARSLSDIFNPISLLARISEGDD